MRMPCGRGCASLLLRLNPNPKPDDGSHTRLAPKGTASRLPGVTLTPRPPRTSHPTCTSAEKTASRQQIEQKNATRWTSRRSPARASSTCPRANVALRFFLVTVCNGKEQFRFLKNRLLARAAKACRCICVSKSEDCVWRCVRRCVVTALVGGGC